jgi:hypothetical protein
LRDIVTNQPRAIQRTFLLSDGSDRLHDPMGKATLGRAVGAVIKLSVDDEVTLGLGLAEGVETALTLMRKGWCPVWVTAGAPGMEKFPVLSGIEALTVFADNDANGAGQKAAAKTIDRWRRAGCNARGVMPRTIGQDWNDVVMRGPA